ncbi:MAG: hypothetical protein C5B59_14205 [Bacteroidetes bacterium]|nr:MAG: hypothetical protein C5B59_14205 [Bacteroidota bacterium]
MRPISIFYKRKHSRGGMQKDGGNRKMYKTKSPTRVSSEHWMENGIENGAKVAESESSALNTQMLIHEIRNPLSVISFVSELMLKENEQNDGSLFSYAELISKNAQRIEAILRELLNPNENSAEFVAVDICDLIEKSLQKADDKILLKKIHVIKSYGFDMVVKADPERLSIAILNIIINAVEALKYRGKLWITVYKTPDEVKVIFKDNGAGMMPEVASHMFEKNVSGKSCGLGLGLWIVKSILEEHDANIIANSEIGTGTTIVMSFKQSLE